MDKNEIDVFKEYVNFLNKRKKELLENIAKLEKKESDLQSNIDMSEKKLRNFPDLLKGYEEKMGKLRDLEVKLNVSVGDAKCELNSLKNTIIDVREDLKREKRKDHPGKYLDMSE